MSEIQTVNVSTLKKWLKSNEVFLIDVRSPLECSIERIAGAKNIPLSDVSIKDIDPSEVKGKKIVLQCRAGIRSMTACEKLIKEDPNLELWNLEGGILAWEQKGFKVIQDTTIMPKERQMQIILGSIIFLSSMMAYFVNANWIIIPVIISCGLINAGITGWCGMQKLVNLLPWNK